MSRRRDRDDDEWDDRPPPRASNRTMWIVLGVLGVSFLLLGAGCLGVIVMGVFKAGQVFNQGMQVFAGVATAEGFLEDLRNGRSKAAYEGTTARFKSTMTAEQFEQLLKKHPTLTKSTYHTSENMIPSGEPPTKIVVKLTLHTDEPPVDEEDEDDKPPKPKPIPPPKAPPAAGKKNDLPPEIKVSITVVNENGTWKVDEITVP